MENQTPNIVYKMVDGKLQKMTASPDSVSLPVAAPDAPATLTDLGHDKLLSTLYFIFDAFERSGLDFFLVKQTAKDAIAEHQLTGDHIDIGIRNLEWANDQKDVLFPYFDQEHVEKLKEEPGILEFKWQDVPFTIHFYDDNPCTTALIPLVYENEHWKIPNQFDVFCKEFDK